MIFIIFYYSAHLFAYKRIYKSQLPKFFIEQSQKQSYLYPYIVVSDKQLMLCLLLEPLYSLTSTGYAEPQYQIIQLASQFFPLIPNFGPRQQPELVWNCLTKLKSRKYHFFAFFDKILYQVFFLRPKGLQFYVRSHFLLFQQVSPPPKVR